MNRGVHVNEIREFLGYCKSDKDLIVRGVDKLPHTQYTLMFVNSIQDLKNLNDYSFSCVYLVSPENDDIDSQWNDFIKVENPKYQFCRVVDHFGLKSNLQLNYASMHKYDLNNMSNVRCSEVFIGKRCQIDITAIIGADDFSPVLTDEGTLVQFPQLGGVRIGNDVVIKPYSMIGKGTFDYTVIGDNTMIDYGCQIGHNCVIGNSCIIAAGTIIGGSTTVDNNTVIGIGAKIRNGIHIGKNVSIGMGSVVIKDVPDGCTVVGNPARIIDREPIFSEKGLV